MLLLLLNICWLIYICVTTLCMPLNVDSLSNFLKLSLHGQTLVFLWTYAYKEHFFVIRKYLHSDDVDMYKIRNDIKLLNMSKCLCQLIFFYSHFLCTHIFRSKMFSHSSMGSISLNKFDISIYCFIYNMRNSRVPSNFPSLTYTNLWKRGFLHRASVF